MKKLCLIRHSKSSWDDPFLDDIYRPLNLRGQKDATLMAKRMQQRGFKPDIILSSPAKRAKQSAYEMAESLHYDIRDIVFVEDIYDAMPNDLVDVISDIDNRLNFAFLFGHNDALEDLIVELFDIDLDKFATSAILCMSIDSERWEDFYDAPKEVFLYDFPKNRFVV
jgi:phosphohistidine phosphatase